LISETALRGGPPRHGPGARTSSGTAGRAPHRGTSASPTRTRSTAWPAPWGKRGSAATSARRRSSWLWGNPAWSWSALRKRPGNQGQGRANL